MAMLARAIEAQVPFRWVTGDEVYGGTSALRSWPASQNVASVLAIAYQHRCGPRGQNARTISPILPKHAWEIRSAGHGAHGLREYAWALAPLLDADEPTDGFEDALLIRRNLADGERAYYLVHAPAGTSLPEIVRARRVPLGDRGVLPGREERGRSRPLPGPPLSGLVPAHHPGHGRRRPPDRDPRCSRRKRGHRHDLIRLSVNEIRRLTAKFTHIVRHEADHILHWSRWRHRHQHRARLSHYRRRGHPPP
ncbi:hypothetical protein GCM10010400_27220 [Streptomyces aculeolatus]